MSIPVTVLLDGSPLSERALPYALQIATRTGSALTLVRVVEGAISSSYSTVVLGETRREAAAYLQRVKHIITDPHFRLHMPPARVRCCVVPSPIDSDIATCLPLSEDAMVVMTTRGRSGFRRLVPLSFATKLLTQTAHPLILLCPAHLDRVESLAEILHAPSTFDSGLNTILVSLDGSCDAEKILAPAQVLAHELKVSLTLLHVVGSSAPIAAYTSTPAISGCASQRGEGVWDGLAAQAYLSEKRAQVTAAGVVCLTAIRHGEPVVGILAFAEESHPLFLAMATHAGVAGDHHLVGSVADTVLRRSHLPIVMVRSDLEQNTPNPCVTGMAIGE